MAREWVNFQAVKASVSFAEVLRYYGIDRLRRRRPDHLEGCCPIHGGHRVDAFHVSLSKNAFQCFACQAHGSVLDFVAAMERCSMREAACWLARRFGGSAGELGTLGAVRLSMTPEANWLGKKEGDNRPLAFTLRGVDSSHPYLRDRGILPETAARFGIGYYAGPGLMSRRVVIPIHDRHGKLVAYAGRSVDGTTPKYRLPAEFRKTKVLFNFHRVAALQHTAVIVVEGYFDCLNVRQAGFPSVVALMGVALSSTQANLLVDRFRRVILMLDGDDAGRSATVRIANQLAGRCGVSIAELPWQTQPDQLDRDEIANLLAVVFTEADAKR